MGYQQKKWCAGLLTGLLLFGCILISGGSSPDQTPDKVPLEKPGTITLTTTLAPQGSVTLSLQENDSQNTETVPTLPDFLPGIDEKPSNEEMQQLMKNYSQPSPAPESERARIIFSNDTYDEFPNVSATNLTSGERNILASFLNNSERNTVSRYLLHPRITYTPDGRLSRYAYSVNPDGTTESFAEISDAATMEERENSTITSSDTEPDDVTQTYCDMRGLRRTPSEEGIPLTLLTKDTVIRNYTGLAKVCIVTSVYWQDQESDRRRDHFTLDSHVKITPEQESGMFRSVKTRDVSFTYNFSQNNTGFDPLTDLWVFDPRPEDSDLREAGSSRGPEGIVPWYEALGGPFGSSITLTSDETDVYSWRISTGYFSSRSENPQYLNPRTEIVIKQNEGRDSRIHLLGGLQFNGTGGWCRENGWFCEDAPADESVFGSEFYIRWKTGPNGTLPEIPGYVQV